MMSDDYTLSRAERDNLIKYDFVPVYSDDDIEKFLPLAALAGKALTAGRAVAGAAKVAGKGALQAGKKVGKVAVEGGKGLGRGAKHVGGYYKDKAVDAGKAVVETAKKVKEQGVGESFKQAVNAGNQAVKDAMERRQERAASTGGGSDASQSPASSAIQGAMAMNAGNAQAKQAQEQRAMDMARRGATIQTGEPMNLAWRMLKGE
jgi:hypothetical protein